MVYLILFGFVGGFVYDLFGYFDGLVVLVFIYVFCVVLTILLVG